MSTPDDREPAAEDLDPTGVRAMLSSLPDPGPMPPDLADRITTRLRQEQSLRAGQADELLGATPLASRRARGSAHQWLAAAAAVAVVAVGGAVVFQSALGDQAWDTVAAFYPSTDDAAADDAAAGDAEAGDGDAGAEAMTEMDDGGEERGSSEVLGVVEVLPTTTALGRDTFAVGAHSAVVSPQEESSEGSDTASTALDPQAARSCVAATGGDASAGAWLVGSATLDDEPAVLVVDRSTDPLRAWAVAPGCADGDDTAEVLHGPLELP
ncbi:hypothetical protein [Ornithinimicrobium sediminis]|uniref:hypothetical protein n=1 Tax=Ornithinimicrobium sediminis TaxID=2904603 RepID=UPI001E4F1621|nr:hypothetical protein [Ornithinimicrobium sediminis]MCE0486990.1 hypothetical protein [Ornithinimicrobium sediminis]